MQATIQVVQVASAAVIIFFVLLQVRGTGLGRNASSASFTRRGLEKTIFKGTFLVAFIFLLSSFIALFIK
jgi:protein translocase SecG subunit